MKHKLRKFFAMLSIVVTMAAFFMFKTNALDLSYSGSSLPNNTGASATTSGFSISYSDTSDNICGYRFSIVSSTGVPKSGTKVANVYLSDISIGKTAHDSGQRFIISSGVVANKKQLANGTKVTATSTKQSCDYLSGNCGFYSTLAQAPSSIGNWIKNSGNSYQNLQRIYVICGSNLANATESDYVLIEPIFWPKLAGTKTAATATELAIYGAGVSGGDQYKGTDGNLYNAGSGTLWNLCNYINRNFPNALYVSSNTDVYSSVSTISSGTYTYKQIIQNGYGCSVLTVRNVITIKTAYISYYCNGGTVTSSNYSTNGNGHVTYNGNLYFQSFKHGTSGDPYNAATFGLKKTGYTFGGWKVRSTGKILEQDTNYASTVYAHHNDSTKTTANTTEVYCYLDAVWTPNKVNISYWVNGGKISSSSYTLNASGHILHDGGLYFHSISYGSTGNPYDASTFGLTKTGYTFAGWKVRSTEVVLDQTTNRDSTIYAQYDNSSKTTANTATVYCYLDAVWTPNKVNITYWVNGGKISSSSYTLNASGHILYNGGLYFHSIAYGSTGNPYDAATFGLTKAGYTFAGWKVRSTGTILDQTTNRDSTVYAQYDNSSKTTANTGAVYCYLDAVWTPNKVYITYQTNGGTVTSPYSLNTYNHISDGNTLYFHTLNYGESDDPYNASTFGLKKEGYKFAGWKVYSTGKILDQDTSYASTVYASYSDSSKTTANTNGIYCYLIAEWTPNKVYISYYADGGTVTSPYSLNTYNHISDGNTLYFHTLNYGETDDPYNASTFGLKKEGYKFAGWKVRSTGKILDQDTQYGSAAYAQHDNSSITTGNTATVYCYLDAVWTPNKVNISYYANGGVVTSPYSLNAYNHISNGTTLYFHTLNYGETDDPYNASTFGLKKNGYKFAGWKVRSTGKILDQDTKYGSAAYAQYDNSSITTGNTAIVYCYLDAVWEKDVYTNTIIHWKYVGTGGDNSNGTYKKMGSSTFTGVYANSVTIPSNLIQSYTGHYNTGVAGSYWGSSTWSQKNIGSTFTQPSSAVTMEYYYEPKVLTVVFNKNDGSGSTASQSFTYAVSGNKFGYNNNGTPKWGNNSGQFGAWNREGHTLLGWSLSASATSATYSIYSEVTDSWIDSKVTNKTDTLNLYAVWSTNTYTDNIDHWAWGFRGNGNNSNRNALMIDSKNFTKKYGDTFTLNNSNGTTIPNGFYLDTIFGTDSITDVWDHFNFGTQITQKAKNMRFEYDYYPYEYNITYELNGGINNSNNPATYNVLYEKTLSYPTKVGYEFLGWTRRVEMNNLSMSATTNNYNYTRVLNDIEPGTEYRISIANAQVTTGSASIFSTALYDFSNSTVIDFKNIAMGSNIEFTLTCPDTADTTHNICFIIYSGGSGNTSGISTKFTNIEIDFDVTKINNGCDSVFSSSEEFYSEVAKRTTGDIKLIAHWREARQITIVPVDTNAPYREDTEVITSYWLVNPNNIDYINSSGAKIAFSVYNQGGDKVTEDIQNFVCPANNKNLSFFRWYVPDGYGNQTLTVKAHIIDGASEYGHIDQFFEIEPFSDYRTPNTNYEDRPPEDFTVPSVTEDDNFNAIWWQWEYIGGSFVKKEYAVENSISDIVLSAPNSPSAYISGDELYLKSGYGFKTSFVDNTVSMDGFETDSDTYTTGIQYRYALFPEYNYVYDSDTCRSIKVSYDEMGFVYNDDMQRQHFIPIYYPDGEYKFKIVLSDCWTPAGMLTKTEVLTINIDGNAYDDWYINHSR